MSFIAQELKIVYMPDSVNEVRYEADCRFPFFLSKYQLDEVRCDTDCIFISNFLSKYQLHEVMCNADCIFVSNVLSKYQSDMTEYLSWKDVSIEEREQLVTGRMTGRPRLVTRPTSLAAAAMWAAGHRMVSQER